MLEENLKELSMDELSVLLAKSQKTLALSKFHRQSDEEIDRNIKQLEKVKKAIEEKRSAAK